MVFQPRCVETLGLRWQCRSKESATKKQPSKLERDSVCWTTALLGLADLHGFERYAIRC